MIPANETFEGTFPFNPHFSIASDFQMHYVDEGEGNPRTLEEVLGNAGVTILHLMKQLQGFENMAAVDQTWVNAYSAHFQTKEDCRGIINFPLDVITGREAQFQLEGADKIAELRQKPAMMAEGMKDFALPLQYFISLFRAAFPNVSVIELENAGHFCQEDQPDTLVALIDQFIQLT